MKIQKTVDVEKESSELAECLFQIVKSAKEALKDGFQPGQDIPAVVAGNFQNLLIAVQGVDQIPAEAKDDVAAFLKAFALPSADIAALFLQPAAAAPVAAPAAPSA